MSGLLHALSLEISMDILHDKLFQKKHSSYILGVLTFLIFVLFSSYANLPIRNYLKSLVGGVPYWLDHITFMLLGNMLLAMIFGFLFLKKEEMFLSSPTSRKYILQGLAFGFLYVGVIAITLHFMGILKLHFKLDFPVMLGNLFSNFYEEFIYRGVFLGPMLKFLKGKKLIAVMLSSFFFSLGHTYYPTPILLLVFASGVYWAKLTIDSKPLLPVWISHCVLDFIADAIFLT